MTDLMICNNISSVSLSIRSPGDELYESAQQVGLLPDGLLAEGQDGAVDDRHDVEDLVEEVGHVLRGQVRRGGDLQVEARNVFLAGSLRADETPWAL